MAKLACRHLRGAASLEKLKMDRSVWNDQPAELGRNITAPNIDETAQCPPRRITISASFSSSSPCPKLSLVAEEMWQNMVTGRVFSPALAAVWVGFLGKKAHF